MVSSDFLASDYIWDYEVNRARERMESGSAKVIPIILRPCQWEGELTFFSSNQAVPIHPGKNEEDEKRLEPVSSWEDEDEAWLEVVRAIKKVINN